MRRYSFKKEVAFTLVTIILVGCTTLLISEFLVRIINPVESLYPRWEYSAEYGHQLYKNVTMIEEAPGKWRFTYQINEYRYRGPAIPISNTYDKDNIIVLGDSNSFGQGVNEGEQFPAVMMNYFSDNYKVINLAVGGYGLTQQIRRYYEFGQLYQPSIVILQFASNDPEDNFYNRVAEVKDGRFIFNNVNRPEGWLKNYLSKSIIQKSQLYNYLRYLIFPLLKQTDLNDVYDENNVRVSSKKEIIVSQEEFYNSLLELFAKDLNKKGIRLLMIATRDEALDRFPLIKQKVSVLNSSGYLEYIEIDPWLNDREKYPGSPEGHTLGKEAHHRLGYKLAEYLLDDVK